MDASRPQMQVVVVRPSTDVAIVRVSGEIDRSNVHDLRAAVRDSVQSGATVLIFSVAGVTYVDSTGLGVMAAAATRLRKLNGAAVVAAPSEQLAKLLELSGITDLLTVVPTEDEALRLPQPDR